MVHRDDHIIIVSTDTDFIQLLEDKEDIQLWNPVKKLFVEKVSNYAVRKSLIGDATDNVPGISGVGHAKASALASDPEVRQKFFDKNPGTQEIFERAYKMIRFKNVSSDEVNYVNSAFNEEKLLEEFTNREFKSIIGKSWPKWCQTFERSN